MSKGKGRSSTHQSAKEDKRFLRRLALNNLLSFKNVEIEFGALNVLIGPNASGKSNLIEALDLLCAAGRRGGVSSVISTGGGINEWKHKEASEASSLSLTAIIRPPALKGPLRHHFELKRVGESYYKFADERIENEEPNAGETKPYFYFGYERGIPTLNVLRKDDERDGKRERHLQREKINPEESILTQRQDAEEFPELWDLALAYEQSTFYRDWQIGRSSTPRKAQRADLPPLHLLPDASNLGAVLNQLKKSGTWDSLLETARELHPDLKDIHIDLKGGLVELAVRERDHWYPATRLSDGTLRFLSLLAILYDPNPPPLVCIEEPELGLHPDIQVTIAKLLVEASERMQLVVTTHSEMIVSTLSETPESVIVCEKDEGETKMIRLNAKDLKGWLEDYCLGDLWLKGFIGGTRW